LHNISRIFYAMVAFNLDDANVLLIEFSFFQSLMIKLLDENTNWVQVFLQFYPLVLLQKYHKLNNIKLKNLEIFFIIFFLFEK
jgi:hypothetical protein